MSTNKRLRLEVEALEDRQAPSVNPATGEIARIAPKSADHGKPEVIQVSARTHAAQEHLFDGHTVTASSHGEIAHGLFHNEQPHSLVHDPVHSDIDHKSTSLIHDPAAIHTHEFEETPRQRKLRLAADYVNGLIDRDVMMLENGDIMTQDELRKLKALKDSQKDGYREHMLPNDIRIETIIM